MAGYGYDPYENGSKYSKLSNFVIVEVVKQSVWGVHQSINKKTVQLEYHLYIIFWHLCITCAGYTANFTNLLLIPFNPA